MKQLKTMKRPEESVQEHGNKETFEKRPEDNSDETADTLSILPEEGTVATTRELQLTT